MSDRAAARWRRGWAAVRDLHPDDWKNMGEHAQAALEGIAQEDLDVLEGEGLTPEEIFVHAAALGDTWGHAAVNFDALGSAERADVLRARAEHKELRSDREFTERYLAGGAAEGRRMRAVTERAFPSDPTED